MLKTTSKNIIPSLSTDFFENRVLPVCKKLQIAMPENSFCFEGPFQNFYRRRWILKLIFGEFQLQFAITLAKNVIFYSVKSSWQLVFSDIRKKVKIDLRTPQPP